MDQFSTCKCSRTRGTLGQGRRQLRRAEAINGTDYTARKPRDCIPCANVLLLNELTRSCVGGTSRQSDRSIELSRRPGRRDGGKATARPVRVIQNSPVPSSSLGVSQKTMQFCIQSP